MRCLTELTFHPRLGPLPKASSARRTAEGNHRSPASVCPVPHSWSRQDCLRTNLNGGRDGSLGVRRTGSDVPPKAAGPAGGPGRDLPYFRIRTIKKIRIHLPDSRSFCMFPLFPKYKGAEPMERLRDLSKKPSWQGTTKTAFSIFRGSVYALS